MAALLVSLGVMAVMMSAALPVWRHQAQREKEAELVFRGEQYARAVGLYQRKMGPGTIPPNIDTLVEQKFLRKKYKDPMVPDGEFQIVPFGGTAQPGQPSPGQPGSGQPGSGRQGPGQAQIGPQRIGSPAGMQPPGAQMPGQSSGFSGGGVMGVVSKSREASIRIYRGASYYNQWRFIYVQPQPGPGQDGRTGGPGQPGVQPGQRGGRPGGPGTFPGGRGPGGRGPLGPGGRGPLRPGGRGPGR